MAGCLRWCTGERRPFPPALPTEGTDLRPEYIFLHQSIMAVHSNLYADLLVRSVSRQSTKKTMFMLRSSFQNSYLIYHFYSLRWPLWSVPITFPLSRARSFLFRDAICYSEGFSLSNSGSTWCWTSLAVENWISADKAIQKNQHSIIILTVRSRRVLNCW